MDKRAENFKRLAENRTNKILNMLELLGNLSNKSNYSYTQEQIDYIFDTLEKEIKVQRSKFIVTDDIKKKKFRL